MGTRTGSDSRYIYNIYYIYIQNIYTDLDSVARLGRGSLEGEHDLEHVLGGVAGEVPGAHVPQRRLAVDLVRQHGRPEHLHSDYMQCFVRIIIIKSLLLLLTI